VTQITKFSGTATGETRGHGEVFCAEQTKRAP